MAITKLPRNAIADDAINDSKIEDGTIAITEVSGTITNAKLKDGDIANAKLSNSTFTVRGTSRALGDSFNIGVDVTWQSVVTGDTTMAASLGYFVDTSSSSITMTLPSSASAGDIIAIKDYAGTFATNKCIIARNGHNIQGVANNSDLDTNRASLVLVYVDSTKGWLYINEHNVADLQAANFTQATGGTITTSGDFKIHTFTGDGCFVVSVLGNSPAVPTGGPSNVDYLVIAGGAGGGCAGGGGAGGGGAGGHRTTFPSPSCNAGAFPITAQTYPITVGAGGASAPSYAVPGVSGSNSVFSTITSAGGGGGGGHPSCTPNNPNGVAGGSGGGGAGFNVPSYVGTGGAGNTPPVSPSQGNSGGNGTYNPIGTGGAGGGAGGAGGNGGPTAGGAGGNGTANSITGSSVTRAGGGGGATGPEPKGGTPGPAGPGGGGQGGTRSSPNDATSGTANTGGGGGGAACSSGGNGDGGKGIVIIRYKFQ